MKLPNLRTAAISIAALALSWGPTAARADVLPPEPSTFWKAKDIPAPQSIAVAGVCLSAAAIVLGLFAWRLPPRGSAAKTAAVTMITLVAVAGIAAAAYGVYRRAEYDREQWRQYDHAVKNRRWTPPPRFDGPPPESIPPPTSSQSP